jgi:hypothetical protein
MKLGGAEGLKKIKKVVDKQKKICYNKYRKSKRENAADRAEMVFLLGRGKCNLMVRARDKPKKIK